MIAPIYGDFSYFISYDSSISHCFVVIFTYTHNTHIEGDYLYSHIIDTLALLVGIIGLFKEKQSPIRVEIAKGIYIPSDVEQQNLKTKKNIIYWVLFISLVLSSCFIVFRNFGAVPIVNPGQISLTFFNELNSYIFFTVVTLSKRMSSATDLNTNVNSLLGFAKIYTGYISIIQVFIFFGIVYHLVQNLLLLENKSVYLKNNLSAILVKVLLPTSIFLVNFYWKFVL